MTDTSCDGEERGMLGPKALPHGEGGARRGHESVTDGVRRREHPGKQHEKSFQEISPTLLV